MIGQIVSHYPARNQRDAKMWRKIFEKLGVFELAGRPQVDGTAFPDRLKSLLWSGGPSYIVTGMFGSLKKFTLRALQ